MLNISRIVHHSCVDAAPKNRRDILVALSRLHGDKMTVERHLQWLDNKAAAGIVDDDDEFERSAALGRLAELEEAVRDKQAELKQFDQLSGA